MSKLSALALAGLLALATPAFAGGDRCEEDSVSVSKPTTTAQAPRPTTTRR